MIATGGFAHNDELVKKVNPNFFHGQPVKRLSVAGSTGDGIAMVQEIGGAIVSAVEERRNYREALNKEAMNGTPARKAWTIEGLALPSVPSPAAGSVSLPPAVLSPTLT